LRGPWAAPIVGEVTTIRHDAYVSLHRAPSRGGGPDDDRVVERRHEVCREAPTGRHT
jgi:hypothetical protein